jgi:hypothetical protein
VNGIQCAARSFGTATGVGRGLLSSMGGLFSVLGRCVDIKLSVSPPNRNGNAGTP